MSKVKVCLLHCVPAPLQTSLPPVTGPDLWVSVSFNHISHPRFCLFYIRALICTLSPMNYPVDL